MPEEEVFIGTDRYGGHHPDRETMCKGQCEGMGCYPHHRNGFGQLTITETEPETPEEAKRWEYCHEVANHTAENPCDGWHFIQCPDCNGTGKENNDTTADTISS